MNENINYENAHKIERQTGNDKITDRNEMFEWMQ